MRKVLKRGFLVIAFVLLLIIIAAVILFWNELRSLASIKKVDAHPLYQMTYYGDYGFDEFLETGAESDRDIEAFVVKRLLRGVDIDLNITGAGCTVFVADDEEGNRIFARNFDFDYAPAVQIITTPQNGYRSISTVNLSFVGYHKDNLPNFGLSPKSFLMLAAPYMPFDGMNEKGLAIALLAVPKSDAPYDENKVTLNTTTSIRLVLDKAATVDEAIDLLSQYNIYFSGDVDCQFLIADASGNSVLVEYWDGDLKVIPASSSCQVASNFIAYNGLNIGEGFTEIERFETVNDFLDENDGTVSAKEAADLLTEVSVYAEESDRLQWSVIYRLNDLDGEIFAGRNREDLIPFSLAQ